VPLAEGCQADCDRHPLLAIWTSRGISTPDARIPSSEPRDFGLMFPEIIKLELGHNLDKFLHSCAGFIMASPPVKLPLIKTFFELAFPAPGSEARTTARQAL